MSKAKYTFRVGARLNSTHDARRTVTVEASSPEEADTKARQVLDDRAHEQNCEAPVRWDLELDVRGNSMRDPKVGDRVTINVDICARNKQEGEIISISSDKNNSMPYMVRFDDYFVWPFNRDEFINDSIENEVHSS